MSKFTHDNEHSTKNENTDSSIESSQQSGDKVNLVSSRSSTKRTEVAVPKRSQPRIEKRVSIDIVPMSLEEIEWAMTDCKIQDEEREIQEARERIRRKKEARAKKLALANE
jgi:hypothetical protein